MTRKGAAVSGAFVAGSVCLALSCRGLTAPDVRAYQQLLIRAKGIVAQHLDAGTQANSIANCVSEHASYDSAIRPLIEQMDTMSGSLDSCMMGFGDSTDAQFRTTCASMMSELDVHAQLACQSSNLLQDQAETRRDYDVMSSYLAEETNWANTMGGMMGPSMMSAGGCCCRH